jgi:hypothetical protein
MNFFERMVFTPKTGLDFRYLPPLKQGGFSIFTPKTGWIFRHSPFSKRAGVRRADSPSEKVLIDLFQKRAGCGVPLALPRRF